MSVRYKGSVVWFDDSKGQGYLETPDCAEHIFVHYTAIVTDGFKTLAEDQQVEFSVEGIGKRARAVQVVKL